MPPSEATDDGLNASSLLEELAAAGRRIGSHKELTQGAGGNISHKRDGSIWIKSSGTWLENADAAKTFSRVAQRRLQEAVRASLSDGAELDLATLADDGQPRPSMEVAVHSLLSMPVVLHVHSVAVIALCIRSDGQQLLAQKLAGLRWRWIPYVKPGRELAEAVAARVADQPEVLVLANHGLFVQASTMEQAESLLADVEQRVATPVVERLPQRPVLEQIAADSGMVVPASDIAHQAAFHKAIVAKVTSSPYPDHTVYLGAGPLLSSPANTARRFIARLLTVDGNPPPYLIVEDIGVLVAANANSGVVPMLECLGLVLARIAADAELTLLTGDQERALSASPAERYRIALGTTNA